MNNKKPAIEAGSPGRLGAHWDGRGVNFALFSANGEKVELCLFDEAGNETRLPLPARAGEVWHGYVPGLKPGQRYGYRVHGPDNPREGHRFNPRNLLIDPYAREVTPDLSLGRVVAPWPDDHDRKPDMAGRARLIYEAHVRGLTMKFPGLDPAKRGKFTGVADDKVIAHLKSLKVTDLELLPVHSFLTERFVRENGKTNYWGYNTLGFFAPAPQYGTPEEFREMVRKLHAAGIRVILDVVYNHSCEGGPDGPAVNFRGIDNARYYRLHPHDKSRYVDMTGCSNTLNTDDPQVRRMILDSLRYWVEEMHVDGIRFDLTAVLARSPHGFSRDHPLLQAIEADPVLSKTVMIAEPWSGDFDAAGYQLGKFSARWSEWNDQYRDTVRAFWRGDDGMAARLADRLAGSRRCEFGGKGTPAASINFITAHDGFTLRDWGSYNTKHNEANGEDNRDGRNDNFSWNHGVEGDTDDPAVSALRSRQQRNMLATLFLSQGTPMLLGGDEIGNSQGGNNNVYCQDNDIGWISWDKADAELLSFTQALAQLRQDYPVLRRETFMDDIRWFAPGGREQTIEDWHNPHARCLGMMLPAEPAKKQGRLLAVFNTHSGGVPFRLPDPGRGSGWRRLLDTAEPALRPGGDQTLYKSGETRAAPARSVTLFLQNPEP